MAKYVKSLGIATVLLCGMLLFGGCASDAPTASEVRWNWAPELRSLTLHEEMHKTVRARAIQTNIRMMQEDIDRMLLIDRPSSLTAWDVPR